MKKVCRSCKKELPISMFCKHTSTSDRRSNKCRDCRNKWQIDYRNNRGGNIKTSVYEKSEKGFLVRLYRNMKSRIEGVQKTKFHLYEGKELIGKEDFYEWALNNADYKILFDNYTQSGYKRKLAPSVDRINPEYGYTKDNMEFVTMSVNCARSNRTKNGNDR